LTVLAALLLATGSAVVAASPAHAATGDPTDPNYLGALAVTPTSGSSNDSPAFTSLSTTSGFPESHRVSSRTLIYGENSEGVALLAALGAPRPATHPSLTAPAITLAGTDGNSVSLGSRAVWSQLAIGGRFKILLTGESTAKGANGDLDGSKYFAVTLEKTSDTTWKVATSTPPVEKTATETVLTAAGTTETSTTLTATVDPAAATGRVTFKGGSLSAEGVQIDVSGGTATYTVTGLTAATDYSFTAEYSGDATHEASASAAKSVTTLPAGPVEEPADTEDTEVGVEVPEVGADAGLIISAAPESVTLTGGTRDVGADWTATGTLGTVTVTDNRQKADAAGWSLTGASSAFVSGENSFPASKFGWTPKGATGAGQAGEAATDLSSAKTLATGAASAEPAQTTSVDADLSLTVPSGAPAGDYKATLTLTLI
jgi:hypothetical protein